MKSVLLVLLLLFLVIAATTAANKRYYDSWHSNNDDDSSDENDNTIQLFPYRQKSLKKEDPCANKPLWYLKYQARLGKLSPFYDCLSIHGI